MRMVGSTLTILVPIMAIGAPLLTGTYYLVLASGSAAIARQMMLATDPIQTALALTVGFFPALLAIAATTTVFVSRGRFHLATAYGLVFVAVVFSGSNLDFPVWGLLGFLAASNFILAWLVPSEYPGAMLRFARDRNETPEFVGLLARWVRRHRRLDRIVAPVAIATLVINILIVVTLTVGILVNQFTQSAGYELTFEGDPQPIQVVWFSMESTGTWYVTETSDRGVEPGAMAARDLEWSADLPASIVACGLASSPCSGG